MVKTDKTKPKKPRVDTKKLASVMGKVGGAFKDIAIGAACHPVTASLFVMGSCVLLQFATGAFSDEQREKHPTLRNVHGQLNGLYDGAQKIAAASAVAPIAVSAFQMLGDVAKAKGATAAAAAQKAAASE
jgi:hypothetical protein